MSTQKTTVNSKTQTVSCEGDSKQGHPKIYLSLKNQQEVKCPYCSKIFINPKNS